MKRVRTFIAVPPGNAIRDRLISLQEKLLRADVKAKWVEPDNIHVTLLFLGEVDYVTVPGICEAVAGMCAEHSGFFMTVGKLGCFPNARRPRVLWAGVTEGAEEIIAIHDDVEDALVELGCYRRENRKYTPHLTIGRLQKEQADVDLTAILAKHDNWKAGDVDVDEILIMSSELTPKGPVYTVLGRAPLDMRE